ncbi:hypothetical protein AGMMS50276_14840 [Synergistales bacterium]|nr:hypothetical protein AGMMS50276_14840 [Synergistales bacterium]
MRSVAALTWGFMGARLHSINLFLAHALKFITLKYNSVCDVYDFVTPGASPRDFRQPFDMYGVESSPSVSIRGVNGLEALSEEFFDELAAHDVLLVNIFHWGSVISRLKAKFPHIKVIYYIHSLLVCENAACGGLSGERFALDLKNQESLIAAADGVIFPSHAEADYARRLYGIKKPTTVVYPLPIIPARVLEEPDFLPSFVKRRAPLEERVDNRIKFVYIGRCVRQKGLETLVDAFFKFFTRSNRKSLLTFVSDSNEIEEISETLSDRAKGKFRFLQAQNAIHLIDWINSRKRYLEFLHSLLIQNSIVIAPSLYDPFNIAVYEALSFGIKTVVSRLAGVTELLPDAHEGPCRLINPTSPLDAYLGMLQMANAAAPNRGTVSFPITPEMSYEALFRFMVGA